MKKDSAPSNEINDEVGILTALRAQLLELTSLNKDESDLFNRKAFDELILRCERYKIINPPYFQ